MIRLVSSRLLLGLLLFGLVCMLPGCGLLGGNGDDGDDGKFPEPPDRPNSAYIVPLEVGPASQPVAEESDGCALTTQILSTS